MGVLVDFRGPLVLPLTIKAKCPTDSTQFCPTGILNTGTTSRRKRWHPATADNEVGGSAVNCEKHESSLILQPQHPTTVAH